ncbi:hypothetical protein [Saccharopolyspora endophytica]|uniref:Integral membrane protein n=1 Tax=Saccharopolyspora endophytica TaxID=543886 RepID=A0ABS5DRJ2_9PSEU|nr:hypothetical protein [Saccharopolyspora endophytica]MBQ0928815.1 hypothetical protein [Saccharopolyspora endophytica]
MITHFIADTVMPLLDQIPTQDEQICIPPHPLAGEHCVLAPFENPTVRMPPGADKIMNVAGNVKWGAGVALMVGFFMGLLVWAGGRWVDHHRAGKVGVIMMLCAVGGGILYGVGYQLISTFAAGG